MNNAEFPNVTSGLVWFKSSYSGTEGGQCVEVATGATAVHIRDSKTAAGPVIAVSRATWAEFIDLAAAPAQHI